MTEKRLSLTNAIKTLNKQRRLALFVGAGVSIGCGLPNWNELTRRVVASAWKNDPITIELLNGHGNIQAVRYARKRVGEDFNHLVRNCLYENDYVISDLVHAIACSGIGNICSYNFDDLLEDAFLQSGIDPVVAVLGEKFSPEYHRPSIIHPHGILERHATREELKGQRIIFSETDYNDLYSDPYSWANLSQISMLISYSVLFIGVSLTDPSLRRIIDATRRRGFKNQHFAVFLDPVESAEKEIKAYAKKVKKMREMDLKELGITPWFIKSYDNLISLIKNISVEYK